MVRKLLDGRFENSIFTIFAPDGETQLTEAGRGPNQVFGGPPHQNASKVAGMKAIADKYEATGDPSASVLQDFHSFGQALNVAAAEQRVLVVLQGDEEALAKAKGMLRPLATSAELIGRFHYDSGP